MSEEASQYVQAVGLGLDPGWRHRSAEERAADGRELAAAEAETTASGVRTLTYSSVGLEPGVDLVLLRLAPTIDALEEAGARLARSGLGRWLVVRHSILGRISASQYVRKPTEQERSVLDGQPARYLIVYPFTKSAEWYLLSREARQGVMNEHMRVGRGYPTVRQLLAYSFGIDDGDFLVAYDTDDLAAFGELVRELRGTEGRRSTINDKPLLLGVRRSIDEFVALLG
ncbi:MAG: chlorite dismutase family protein [Chloroflexi bacterium]|nr:chlorite dismutase family protein [Chloroflexota bacterium]